MARGLRVVGRHDAGDDLAQALAALESGGVVAVPTDTVYGLAADPRRPGATDALFSAKGRPETFELPVLVADAAQAESVAELSDRARRLAERFWPGPLTVVVRRRGAVGWSLGGDGRSVGVRCPAHPVPLALCAAAGPLAVTSANRHGDPPLVSASAVRDAFGDVVAFVVDGGTCAGAPSTVVDLTGPVPRCLRRGVLAWDEVEAVLTR